MRLGPAILIITRLGIACFFAEGGAANIKSGGRGATRHTRVPLLCPGAGAGKVGPYKE